MALENDNELIETIRKAVLLNAVQHGGKAQSGPIIGRLLGEKAELRTNAKDLIALVDTVLNEVNSLSVGEQNR